MRHTSAKHSLPHINTCICRQSLVAVPVLLLANHVRFMKGGETEGHNPYFYKKPTIGSVALGIVITLHHPLIAVVNHA